MRHRFAVRGGGLRAVLKWFIVAGLVNIVAGLVSSPCKLVLPAYQASLAVQPTAGSSLPLTHTHISFTPPGNTPYLRTSVPAVPDATLGA
jgi:hypothetical protein